MAFILFATSEAMMSALILKKSQALYKLHFPPLFALAFHTIIRDT